LCQRAWARRKKLNFVPKRLIVTEEQQKSDVSYRSILKKKNAPTLASLYDVFTNTKDEHGKATRWTEMSFSVYLLPMTLTDQMICH